MNYNFPTGHHATRNTQTPIPTASNTEGTAPPITSRQPPRRHRLPLAAIVSLLPLSPDQHIAVDSRLRFSQRVRGGQDLLQAASITKTRFRSIQSMTRPDWAAFVTASVRLSEFSGWYKRQTAKRGCWSWIARGSGRSVWRLSNLRARPLRNLGSLSPRHNCRP
jgi:hypothetical protein